MPFRVGQRLWIACDVKPGMSPSERSIRFVLPAPEEKVVSGFVPERFVRPRSNGLPSRVAAVVASPPYFTKLKPQRRPVRPAAEGFDPSSVTKTRSYESLARPVFTLRPREFILGFTLEEVSIPGWLAANVQGKSSLARAGLAVHITAPHINPGFVARITLEMYNHGPWNLQLIPGKDLVCQVIFYKLTSPVSQKVINAFGTYKKQSTPYPARSMRLVSDWGG